MHKNPQSTYRLRPDLITEELVSALSGEAWFEFKPLFLIVRASLRERDAAHGDPEMLRLRAYDKLQKLVQQGLVEKNGKQYRGVAPALSTFKQHLAAEHCQELLNAIVDPAPPVH